MCPQHRLRRGTLQEGARRGVNRRTQEVIRGGVADVQLDARIERGDVHQVGLAEAALLRGWLRCERFDAQLGYGPHRLDTENARPGLGHRGAHQQDEEWSPTPTIIRYHPNHRYPLQLPA